jgi:hypothetical protein
MNADTRQSSQGRLADLNPFDIKVMIETAKPAPCKPAAPWAGRFTEKLESEAHFGCVDWYQYHHEADETHAAKNR